PGLDGTPVVGEQVHGSVGRGRLDHGPQILGESVEPVGLPSPGPIRVAGAAHVVGDDTELREVPPYVVPQRGVVRVSVHTHERGRVLGAVYAHRQPHTVADRHRRPHRFMLGRASATRTIDAKPTRCNTV